MSRLAVNDVRLEARCAGSGIPLLLLHGFTGRGSSWAGQLSALQRSHRTIAVDLLGHGRSDAPADPYRYAAERQAADLAQLLGALGASPADVLGYSMGARIALQLAVDVPSVVRRLVLESPSAGIADAAERERRRADDEALARMIEREGIPRFIDHWQALPIFAGHAALTPAARRRLRRQRLGHPVAGLANGLRGAGRGVMAPLHARLRDLRLPVLVIAGSQDPNGREQAIEVAQAIPAARLEIIDGAGHTPHLEQATIFGRHVVAFLTATAEAVTHRGSSLVATPTAHLPRPPRR